MAKKGKAKRSDDDLFVYINNGPFESSRWSGRTNHKYSTLFFWTEDEEKHTLTLHYTSLWYNGVSMAPYLESQDGASFFIEAGKPIASFRHNDVGSAYIKAPRAGMINILTDFGTPGTKDPQIPDDSEILIIDYSEETVSACRAKLEEERLKRLEEKAMEERKQIRDKLLEKQRIKNIEKEIMHDLIVEGLAFPNTRKKPYISRKLVDEVWNRDCGQCVYCGARKDLHIDHIIPLSKGGATRLENLQILCGNCECKKGDNIG